MYRILLSELKHSNMKKSPLLILFTTVFLDLLGFGLILPLLPVYIQHYGGTPQVGGFLLASFSCMQFIFSPIWGRASDKYGRRPLILMSLIGSAISYFMFGSAPNLAWLFGARVAAGILTAASLPASYAYIADVTSPEKRAGGMAMIGAAFGLGFAFGPWLGGVLSKYSIFGHPALATPSYFAAGLALIAFVWAFFMLPESHHNRHSSHDDKGLLEVFPTIARSLRRSDVGAQLTVFAFATFAFTAVESSFSWLVILRFHSVLTAQAAKLWNSMHPDQLFSTLTVAAQKSLIETAQTAATSKIFGIVGITILIVQVAVMRGLARKIGENRLVMLGSVLLTCTLIGIAIAPTLPLIWVLSAMIAVGNGVMNPSLGALITHAAGPKDRGSLTGAQQGLGSLARIIAPPINNTLVGVNSAIPFVSSSALMAIAFFLSLRLKPLPHTDKNEPAPPAGMPMDDATAEPVHP